MNPIREVVATAVVLPDANVDTDRIIPARFLTTTVREGLGRNAFHDWRYAQDGKPDPKFPLNRVVGESVLVAGSNFGCGSSREHAPWALLDAGVRAVVSTAIADIFRNNALKNGLLALVVDEAAHHRLVEADGAVLCIDVAQGTISAGGMELARFTLDPFVRACLLAGVDELGYLMQREPGIAAYEEARACAV